jgi:aconitase B
LYFFSAGAPLALSRKETDEKHKVTKAHASAEFLVSAAAQIVALWAVTRSTLKMTAVCSSETLALLIPTSEVEDLACLTFSTLEFIYKSLNIFP